MHTLPNSLPHVVCVLKEHKLKVYAHTIAHAVQIMPTCRVCAIRAQACRPVLIISRSSFALCVHAHTYANGGWNTVLFAHAHTVCKWQMQYYFNLFTLTQYADGRLSTLLFVHTHTVWRQRIKWTRGVLINDKTIKCVGGRARRPVLAGLCFVCHSV